MFTGITQGCFPVIAVEKQPDCLHYCLRVSNAFAQSVAIGASIAVDGVCQTVTDIQTCTVMPEHCLLSFDAITETLAKTTLRYLHVDALVSLERSARIGDEIGGHLISGHVHGTGTIQRIIETPERYVLHIHVPEAWMPYIFPQGFIAIDGSSLTIVDYDKKHCVFTVHLIPETRQKTNLGRKAMNDAVNIELDQQTRVIVDTVKHLVNS